MNISDLRADLDALAQSRGYVIHIYCTTDPQGSGKSQITIAAHDLGENKPYFSKACSGPFVSWSGYKTHLYATRPDSLFGQKLGMMRALLDTMPAVS